MQRKPESTTQGVSEKTKQQIEQAQKTGQPIPQDVAEQYVREVTASKNADGAVNLTVQREGANLIVGGDGLQNATVDLSTLDSYSSLSIARNGLADHFGDSWYGSSAGRDLNLRFMTAQHDVMEKTLSTPIHESASYQAGMARGYNNATFHARDRIAQQQRFAQNSSNIASANQAMYDREQARAKMSTLDKVQLALDVTGMSEIPVVSQLADLGSAGISVYNGDYVGAGLSMGSMIPVAGKAFEGTRAARFAERVASSRPEWLQKLDAGNDFNRQRAGIYDIDELYIDKPGGGYVRLDSYNINSEIVSRKFTQLGDIQDKTGLGYLRELSNKYPAGSVISNVPSSGGLAGQRLNGDLILEVPVQVTPVPTSIVSEADRLGILIRDINGKIY